MRRERPAGFGHRIRFRGFSAGPSAIELGAIRNQSYLYAQLVDRGVCAGRYRISRGLSFNVGLRYEYFAPYTELYNHLANLLISPDFTSVSVALAGQSGLPTSLVRPEKANFSPRFGYAYRPFAKRSLIFRGGYSIFYSGSPYGTIASSMAAQPPFATTATLSTSVTESADARERIRRVALADRHQYLRHQSELQARLRANLDASRFRTRCRTPLSWSSNISARRARIWESSRRRMKSLGTSLATAQQNLKIADATGFTYQTYGANSIFNAGQTRITRRFQRGMSATALYTYSKSIDDASSFTGTGGNVAQFINNWGLERGLSSFDQRHNLSTTYLLSSPVGVHGMMRNGGWKTAALAGWMLSGTFSATSGTPMTAQIGGNLVEHRGQRRAQQSARAGDRPSDRSSRLSLFQSARIHYAAGRAVRQRGGRYDSGVVSYFAECVA